MNPLSQPDREPGRGGSSRPRVGVDIGGTFTDLVGVDEAGQVRIAKRLTTHGAEQRAVLEALDAADLDLGSGSWILGHGSTLVINALLERRGARTVLVTTQGFEDVLELARGSRHDAFDLRYTRDEPLVPASRRLGISERTSAEGEVLLAPDGHALQELADRIAHVGADAVGIALLHSWANPSNERAIARFLRARWPSLHVTASHEISSQWREYERSCTTAANAYVAPVVARYLGDLLEKLAAGGHEGETLLLDSAGGSLPPALARRFPARLVESGPVAGVIAARSLAVRLGRTDVVTFDMGGTTAKAAVVDEADFARTDAYWIGGPSRGFPIQVPTVDIVEVGAGGGSIAYDDAGALAVGPRSAGSIPGPAAFGRGGTEPTVTDANLVCGRLLADHFMGGMELSRDRAEAAVGRLADHLGMPTQRLAQGILRVAALRMAGCVRNQTLERGRDPRRMTLVAFGGGGPLHACEVALANGMTEVLVPVHPGHFSALGMLEVHPRLDRRVVLHLQVDDDPWSLLEARLRAEAAELAATLGRDPSMLEVDYALTLRYRWQEHGVSVPGPAGRGPGPSLPVEPATFFGAAFHVAHEARFGHMRPDTPLEIIGAEVVVRDRLPVPRIAPPPAVPRIEERTLTWFGLDEEPVETRVLPRASLAAGEVVDGPVILHEEGSTTVVPPGAWATPLSCGTLRIDLSGVGDRP